MQVREAIIQATQLLRNNDIVEPEVEAISLVAHALKLNRTSLYLNYDKVLSDYESQAISGFLERKLNHEPLEYLTNKVNFMGMEFITAPPVFIPRPETEVLVETLVELCQARISDLPLGVVNKGYPLVYDIGTGCGAIGIAALKFLPHAIVYASDIIDLSLAKRNAVKNGVSDRISFIRGNLLDPFTPRYQLDGYQCWNGIDFIISNPPYIPTSQIPTLQPEIRLFESHSSIDGGKDGLFYVRKLIREGGKYLKPDGTLLLELSPEQEDKVRKEAVRYFKSVKFVKDFNNTPRVLIAEGALF